MNSQVAPHHPQCSANEDDGGIDERFSTAVVRRGTWGMMGVAGTMKREIYLFISFSMGRRCFSSSCCVSVEKATDLAPLCRKSFRPTYLLLLRQFPGLVERRLGQRQPSRGPKFPSHDGVGKITSDVSTNGNSLPHIRFSSSSLLTWCRVNYAENIINTTRRKPRIIRGW